jgi:hypothetical protein
MQIPASLRSDFIRIASEQSIHIAGIRTVAANFGRRVVGQERDAVDYLPLGS